MSIETQLIATNITYGDQLGILGEDGRTFDVNHLQAKGLGLVVDIRVSNENRVVLLFCCFC